MTERQERMAEALHNILQWTEAYPVGVFTVPDFEAIRQKIGDGPMAALHGSWARHLLMGIGNIAREGLRDSDDE